MRQDIAYEALSDIYMGRPFFIEAGAFNMTIKKPIGQQYLGGGYKNGS